jgi:hypothetical protein
MHRGPLTERALTFRYREAAASGKAANPEPGSTL